MHLPQAGLSPSHYQPRNKIHISAFRGRDSDQQEDNLTFARAFLQVVHAFRVTPVGTLRLLVSLIPLPLDSLPPLLDSAIPVLDTADDSDIGPNDVGTLKCPDLDAPDPDPDPDPDPEPDTEPEVDCIADPDPELLSGAGRSEGRIGRKPLIAIVEFPVGYTSDPENCESTREAFEISFQRSYSSSV